MDTTKNQQRERGEQRGQGEEIGAGEFMVKVAPNEDRLVMLSDGIFAIATTLLVLDIRLPSGLTVDAFNNALANGFRLQVIIFAVTFYVICEYWVNHRSIINIAKYIDGVFMGVNFLFLGFIAFFPVVSALVQSYNYGPAIVLFTLVLSGCGYTSWVLWFCAIRQHKSHHETFIQEVTTYISFNFLISPTYFMLSLLLLRIPGFDPTHVFYSWIPLSIIQIVSRRITRHHRAVKKSLHTSSDLENY